MGDFIERLVKITLSGEVTSTALAEILEAADIFRLPRNEYRIRPEMPHLDNRLHRLVNRINHKLGDTIRFREGAYALVCRIRRAALAA